MKEIRKINIIEKEKELDEKMADIDQMKDSAKMFRVVRELNRKQYENPFIHDKTGKHVTQPAEIHKIVKKHFKNHFQKPNELEIQTFNGKPKPLNKQIKKLKHVQKC